MRTHRLAALALAAATLLPATAAAQSAGGGVPAYEPPPPAETTARDGKVMDTFWKPGADGAGAFAARSALVADFAGAYARNGKPRLALFWNRHLSDTLNEWYSDTRAVTRVEGGSTMSGDITLNQTNSEQVATAIERRAVDSRRPPLSESFEWEFQDAFLAPFLEAGATVLDRAAILRLTGVDMATGNERTVETRALQGKADYLLEILVAANTQSTTGYELRARILDVTTGAIVAQVNSKSHRVRFRRPRRGRRRQLRPRGRRQVPRHRPGLRTQAQAAKAVEDFAESGLQHHDRPDAPVEVRSPVMKRPLVLALLLPLALAACADERLTPAPGEAPDWPSPSPPRPAHAPLPFTTNYAPSGASQTQPPVPPGENVPYAVRGGQPAAPAAGNGITWNPSGCHKVPTVTFEGKPASTVCPRADGSWAYVAD